MPVAQPGRNGFSRFAIALHWLLAALLFYQLALGWWMGDLPKSPPGLRAGWFNVHKSIGVVIGLLVLVRLGWRAANAVPELDMLPAWQRRAAAWSHTGLYLCMLVLPLSGLLGSIFSGYPVRLFGQAVPLSWPWHAGKEGMELVHGATAFVFALLVALHVAAALWHWHRRDGIASRMGLPEGPRG